MTPATQTPSPRELKLRQRIDVLTDERDRARDRYAQAQLRAERWRRDAYAQRCRAELWKKRAAGSSSTVYLGVPIRVESVGVVVDGKRFESMAAARRWVRDMRRQGRAAA